MRRTRIDPETVPEPMRERVRETQAMLDAIEARVQRGRDWRRGKRRRMSVQQARTWGEGAHLLMATGDDTCIAPEVRAVLAEALAVLWQQERALRAEVAKLQERLGIRPDKRAAPTTEAP